MSSPPEWVNAGQADLCISRFGTMFFADTGSGVFFGSRAWIVTARRP
jgi:hypothetical protein